MPDKVKLSILVVLYNSLKLFTKKDKKLIQFYYQQKRGQSYAKQNKSEGSELN